MSWSLDDTICAIATPPGEGGVGIVRVSGEKAIEAASGLARLRSGRTLGDVRSHVLYRAVVLDGTIAERGPAEGLDEGLVVVMRKPRSYTGEDVVEFHCHGGSVVLETLCRALISRGVRLAEPGEFTRRAFLNGRLDLLQAEAVLDTVQARTSSGLKVAQGQLQGALSVRIGAIRDRLVGLLAEVEAGIDFTDEDIQFIERDALASALAVVQSELSRLAATCDEGRILREGARMALVGRPNVGKSSLWNALLQEDRAIVTAMPGTTRDVLEEIVNMRGVPVRIVDTAGLRETDDPLESEGMRRTRAAIERADLRCVVLDGSCSFEAEDRRLLAECGGKRTLVVVNKADLPAAFDLDTIREHGPRAEGGEVQVVAVSAKTGRGLDELRDAVRRLLVGRSQEPGESVVVSRVRHQTHLNRGAQSVARACESVTGGLPAEVVAMDLRGALDALGELTGAVTTDEILDRIFSEFCIGK